MSPSAYGNMAALKKVKQKCFFLCGQTGWAARDRISMEIKAKKNKKRTAEEINLSSACFSAKPTRFTEPFVPACHSFNKVCIMLALHCRRYAIQNNAPCGWIRITRHRCHVFQHTYIQMYLNKTESVKTCVNVCLKWTESPSQTKIVDSFSASTAAFVESTLAKLHGSHGAAWTVKPAINFLAWRCDMLLWSITAKQTYHQSAGHFHSRCSDWLTAGKAQVLLITWLCSIHSELGHRSKIPAPWN